MALTTAQLTTLAAAIRADTDPAVIAALAGRIDTEIARIYNLPSTFIVWRTKVSREDIYTGNPQPENSTWNWTTYKNQSVTEQNAWTQMFMGDIANFSLANVRAGVAAIFTGSAQATQQRDHVLAVGRRASSKAEKIFATGTGTTVTPGFLGWEGTISGNDVSDALNRNP